MLCILIDVSMGIPVLTSLQVLPLSFEILKPFFQFQKTILKAHYLLLYNL